MLVAIRAGWKGVDGQAGMQQQQTSYPSAAQVSVESSPPLRADLCICCSPRSPCLAAFSPVLRVVLQGGASVSGGRPGCSVVKVSGTLFELDQCYTFLRPIGSGAYGVVM
jgi:hypothetical protein